MIFWELKSKGCEPILFHLGCEVLLTIWDKRGKIKQTLKLPTFRHILWAVCKYFLLFPKTPLIKQTNEQMKLAGLW